jgi:hypothetical protein
MEEIFKDIPGYEGMYQVSNLGRVKSLPKKIKNKLGIFKTCYCRIVSQYKGKRYISVRLFQKTFNVHQLVAMAFLNHKPNGHNLAVDHINNNSLDNRVENLQIISFRENTSKDQKNRSSKYVGVSWDKSRNKWVSSIYINKKNITLGRFDNELEASEYYQNALKAIINGTELIKKKAKVSSEYKGVSWNKRGNNWNSKITINGKQYHIGNFKTELEASESYQNKLKQI